MGKNGAKGGLGEAEKVEKGRKREKKREEDLEDPKELKELILTGEGDGEQDDCVADELAFAAHRAWRRAPVDVRKGVRI